ncbi:helix-turn-helix transcriptional regulator [Cohnella yongneupensis]|uniref:Helix-turn-helix domain-containing protein n=1 Tax=Cohnella yongneupensis TaxID=425006 RepID=A0ABW0QWQ4_9BACL
MARIMNIDFRQLPLYFAYERRSDSPEQFEGIFHAHQGVEILMVHEGAGTLIVDQRSYDIRPGMICVFQPFQLHHVQVNLSEGVPFVRSIVHYEPPTYEAYFDRWPALRAFFKHMHKGRLVSPCLYDLQGLERLSTILLSLHESLPELSRDDYEAYSLFLISFFRAFKTLWEKQSTHPSGEQESRRLHQAERIMEWLEVRYKEPLRLEQMGKDLHLSPHHLSHLFKEYSGNSISDYVSAKRMQAAVILLMSGDYSVARIAEEVGMPNCSHFCKQFKTHFGSTPHQYRKQWHENSHSKQPQYLK